MKEFKINTHSITERDNVVISQYLREINRMERISPEEEARLTALIKKGGRKGENAKEQLIKANLRFVVSVANQYKKYGMELPDLISEGNIGLIKAAELFDETRGFKFISYAVWWIRQSILDALGRNGNIVRVPLNQQTLISRYHRMQHEMMQMEQRVLTIEEFAEMCGYEPERVMNILQATSKTKSVDAPVADDSEMTFLDTMSSGSSTDQSLDNESLHTDLDNLLRKVLTSTEQTVVCNYYGIGCQPQTLDHIAVMIDKSRERTRQLCVKAVDKLRQSPYSAHLIGYLAA